MDLKAAFPTLSKIRFSIVQLLVLMTGIALFFIILMNENEWLFATYTTLLGGVVLGVLVTAICARGERQFFSLGFICCFPVYYISIYSYAVSLPYLLTVKFYEFLESANVDVPSDDHFLVVMGSFWIFLTSFGMGRLGQYWYRKTQEERQANC